MPREWLISKERAGKGHPGGEGSPSSGTTDSRWMWGDSRLGRVMPGHWELSLCGGQGLWPCWAGHCLAGPKQGTWGQSSPGVGFKLPGRGGGRRATVMARCLLTASWHRAPWKEVADRPEESRAGQGRRVNTAWAPATGPKDPARGQEGGGLKVKSPAVSHLHPSTGKTVTLNYRAGEAWMEHS